MKALDYKALNLKFSPKKVLSFKSKLKTINIYESGDIIMKKSLD